MDRAARAAPAAGPLSLPLSLSLPPFAPSRGITLVLVSLHHPAVPVTGTPQGPPSPVATNLMISRPNWYCSEAGFAPPTTPEPPPPFSSSFYLTLLLMPATLEHAT
eukprot:18927-Hanusia_phi.AAC.1